MNYFLLALFWILWYLNYSSRSILSPLLPVIQDALAINHAMDLIGWRWRGSAARLCFRFEKLTFGKF